MSQNERYEPKFMSIFFDCLASYISGLQAIQAGKRVSPTVVEEPDDFTQWAREVRAEAGIVDPPYEPDCCPIGDTNDDI